MNIQYDKIIKCLLTRAAKYSVELSLPPLALITSVNAASMANISLCK